MDTIIIYHSKTGFSQRYAQWLAEDLNCQAVSYRDRKSADLGKYGTIILIGGMYAGNMAGLGWLKKQPLAGKRVAAVAVGCAPADGPGQMEGIEKLFAGTKIQGFYCQGGLAYDRMGAVDRAMMAALRAVLKGKPEMKAMLEVISESFDGSRREYLEPVARWVRNG